MSAVMAWPWQLPLNAQKSIRAAAMRKSLNEIQSAEHMQYRVNNWLADGNRRSHDLMVNFRRDGLTMTATTDQRSDFVSRQFVNLRTRFRVLSMYTVCRTA